jgi:TM2 domain-containing membrane protein YozV
MSFCAKCGLQISDSAISCPKCGNPQKIVPRKSYTTALLLCFFLGVFGIHRFYIGKVVSGILMLFTLGGLGIWSTIDFLILVFSNFKDSNGHDLDNKNSTLAIVLFILVVIGIVASALLPYNSINM